MWENSLGIQGKKALSRTDPLGPLFLGFIDFLFENHENKALNQKILKAKGAQNHILSSIS